MHLAFRVSLVLACACYVSGQTYTIRTVVGGGLPQNGPGLAAQLGYLGGIATDSVLISFGEVSSNTATIAVQ
ncbi:MAG: hypothetical protein ACLP59_27410 [Bryobacteraceae bacterium]